MAKLSPRGGTGGEFVVESSDGVLARPASGFFLKNGVAGRIPVI